MPSIQPPFLRSDPLTGLAPEPDLDAARALPATGRRDVLRAVGLSVALHGTVVLLLALWIDSRPSPSITDSPIVRVTLVPTPAPSAPARETLESVPPDPDPIERVDASSEDVPAAEPEVAARDDRPPASAPARSTDVPPAIADIDLDRLRLQLQAFDPIEPDEDEAGPPGSMPRSVAVPWTARGDAIRGLPIGGGWLNPYVGPVQPRSETWGSSIGEQRGYHVLASGQAICTRTPAPSFSELIHPWKAMRVTLAWDCGRVRGTAPPPDDLDYAPAPAALRAAPSNADNGGTAARP
jgi:hypothetical protein